MSDQKKDQPHQGDKDKGNALQQQAAVPNKDGKPQNAAPGAKPSDKK